jgi:uncharacterized membrane protein
MGPIRGLWHDTWWLWLSFGLASFLLTWFVMAVYVIFFPVLVGMFLYFAFGRYDEHGQKKSEYDG